MTKSAWYLFRISFILESPNPWRLAFGFVVWIVSFFILTGSVVFRMENKRLRFNTTETRITLLPSTFSHASIALSSRLENKTTISDTSNGSVDRSFSLKSMSIPFRIASVAFVLNSASKIEWWELTKNNRSVCSLVTEFRYCSAASYSWFCKRYRVSFHEDGSN